MTKDGEKKLLLEGYPLGGENVKNPWIYKILDDYSFIYAVGGWEWTWYSGLYDLKNFEDHPFNGTEYPWLLVDNVLFTVDEYGRLYGLTKTDLATFETNDLLTDIIDSLTVFRYDISPDGRYFVLYHQDSWNDDTFEYDENYVKICSLESDSLIYSLPIQGIDTVFFCSETQIIACCESYSDYDPGIFLIEIKTDK